MKPKKSASLATSVLLFASLTQAADYYWNPYTPTGPINDGGCWYDTTYQTGTAPGNGDLGRFTQTSLQVVNTYTVTIPSGQPYYDGSSSFVQDLLDGTKVVFDATGTMWAKVRGGGTWPEDWGNKVIFRVGNGDHIFNLEGIDENDPTDVIGFVFSDGKISYTENGDDVGDELVFESGTFDNHSVPYGEGTVNCRHATIILHSSRDNERVVFKGGVTHLRDTQIRGNSAGGEVIVDGGDVHFWDNLKVKTWNSDPVGVLRITNGTATIESGDIRIGNGNDHKIGHIITEGAGKLALNIEWIYFDEPGSSLTMSGDDSVMELGHDIKLGNTVTAAFTGGRIDGASKELMFTGGAGSSLVFGGADVDLNMLVLGGNEGDLSYTNAILQTAGSVLVRGALDFRSKNRNTMYVLEDGTLETRGYVRIGHDGANNGGHAVFRQTGGAATFAGGVNLCDGDYTDGELELLGGVTRTKEIHGWLHCETRDAEKGGHARCLFDGGTLVPYEDNIKLLNTLSEAKVGANGLTVDTEGRSNVYLEAKLEDEGDAAGLFVKTGLGTLKMLMFEEDGGAVGAWANRSLAATHSFTRVARGTLEILGGGGNAACGTNVTVLGGATLALGEGATRLTVTSLTLGDGNGLGVLKLKSGDMVVLNGGAEALSAHGGAVDAAWATADGSYPVFAFADAVTDADLADIAVTGTDGTKDFAWSVAEDPVTGYYIASLQVAPAGTLTKTIIYDGTTAVTNGTGTVFSHLTATASATQSGSLPLAATASAQVADGATLTVHGPITGTGTTFVKTGDGKLVLDGVNSAFRGSLHSNGGTMEVSSLGALGAEGLYFPLILGDGTFKYTGTDEAEFNGALTIRASAHKKPVILDNAGDMTFHSTDYVQGLFIKKGAGTLTFDLDAGTYYLGSGDESENIGDHGGLVDFPVNGNSPTSDNGIYGVNILEGTVKVVGIGTNATTLATGNTAILGGGYGGTVPAALDIENARVNWGAGSRHGHILRDPPAGTPMPEIHLQNAYLWSDGLRLGWASADQDGPLATLVNSTLEGIWEPFIGAGSGCQPRLFATNSVVTANQFGWRLEAKAVWLDFWGPGSVFASTHDRHEEGDVRLGRVTTYGAVGGAIRLLNGARMETVQGIWFQDATLDLVFDGGVFKINPCSDATETQSSWANGSVGTGLRTTGGGVTIDICEGTTHAFDFPILGDGGVVKTGAGTLQLTMPRREGELLVQNTGVTEVAAGTLLVDGGLVSPAASFKVDSGALVNFNGAAVSVTSLEAKGGAIVANGQIDADEIVLSGNAQATFAYATVVSAKPAVTLDFGDGEPVVAKNAPFAVAHLYADANGTPLPAASVNVSQWHGMAKGYTKQTLGRHGGQYVFSYDASSGTLYAEFVPGSGFSVRIR